MNKCKFCNKEINNKGSLASHQLRCKLNPNKIEFKHRESYVSPLKGRPSPLKGKTYEDRYNDLNKVEEIKNKIRTALTGKPYNITDENNKKRIEKIKATAKLRHSIGGKRHGSGRGKKGWYKNIFCDSSWELAYVRYMLEHGHDVKRYSKSFEYYDNDNVKHKYFPDFLVDDTFIVEIKGYSTPQWKLKYNSLSKDINIKVYCGYSQNKEFLDYVISKYGKDFINLYE
jgi:hypothetical protein